MATWSTSRNNHIDGSSQLDRAKQVFILLKDELLSAGWTMIGYGTGTSGSYSMNSSGVTDPFPSFPTITGVGNNSWFAVENADGVQFVVQVNSSGYFGYWWSVAGDYTSCGDEDEDSRPGNSSPPSDEVGADPDSYKNAGYSAAWYCTVAVSGDGNSFVMYGKRSTNSWGVALWKLENYKTGDTKPYVSRCYGAGAAWSDSRFGSTTDKDLMSWHPSAGAKTYQVSQLYVSGGEFMDDAGPDPITSNEQLVEVMACLRDNPYYQIKGKIPQLLRNSNNRSMGDTFDSGTYMCMGSYSLPWGSSTDVLM